jgi:hypothetical protein
MYGQHGLKALGLRGAVRSPGRPLALGVLACRIVPESARNVMGPSSEKRQPTV